MWDYQHIFRHRPISEVVVADTFEEQVMQVAKYAYGTAVVFRDAGFLPNDLELAPPTRPAVA